MATKCRIRDSSDIQTLFYLTIVASLCPSDSVTYKIIKINSEFEHGRRLDTLLLHGHQMQDQG